MKLLSAHYPSIQVTALRAASSFPLVCAYVIWRKAVPGLFRIRWTLHLLRAVLGILMLSMFTYALHLLPLSDAYTIFFIAPALVTALSVPLLKETVSRQRWTAIVVGLIGVLVVLRPSGGQLMSLGGLAVLVAAAAYAISAITVGVLGKTDSSESMVFWVMLLTALGAGCLSIEVWVPLLKQDWPVIATMAVTGFVGQLAITHAFRIGEASAIAPLEYSALAWGIGFDWLLWQTLPDGMTLLGASIIIGSGIYLIRHEQNHKEAEHP